MLIKIMESNNNWVKTPTKNQFIFFLFLYIFFIGTYIFLWIKDGFKFPLMVSLISTFGIFHIFSNYTNSKNNS